MSTKNTPDSRLEYGYSKFLLYNLMSLRDHEFRDAEYNLQWAILNHTFSMYEQSGFEMDTQSEFDRINEFLDDLYPSRTINIILSDGSYLINPIGRHRINFNSVSEAAAYCIKHNLKQTKISVI